MTKDIEFPRWKGYKDLDGIKKLISSGCFDDPKEILEYAAKMSIEREYFKDMLLFLQNRIQKHIETGEGLGIGIDSSKEVFEGLMVVPAEDVAFPAEDENDKYEQFIEDMERANIEYDGEYHGRYFYHGPAVRTDEKGFPTRQDVIRATKIELQWDNLGNDFIIYPK
jgi:hypothetical protein